MGERIINLCEKVHYSINHTIKYQKSLKLITVKFQMDEHFNTSHIDIIQWYLLM
jgi:hypothetical protein